MTLYTIGYGGVDPRVLIAHLREAGVQTVVDVRLRPFSRSAPAYCRDELARLLAAEGLGYIHDEALGNPVQEECRAQGSLEPYARHLDQHREALSPLLALMGRLRVAILCGCPRPDQCHRGVIARRLRDLAGIEIHHLRPPQGEPRQGPAPRILGLTLHQPWASCIAHAGKRVENRSQRPWCPIGTYLAIHAGKALDRAAVRELRREGIALPDQLPSMAIVAVARLESVAVTDNAVPDDQARWWVGPFGWVLGEVTPIEPVPCKGAQGLWRLLPEVQAEVRARFLARRGIQTRTAS